MVMRMTEALKLNEGDTPAETMRFYPIDVPMLVRYFGKCDKRHRFVVEAACIPWTNCPCEKCKMDECPKCGNDWIEFKTVKGTYNSTKCDARCRKSSAPECKCECGGAMHGEAA